MEAKEFLRQFRKMRLSRLRAMMLEGTSTMHGLVIDAIFPAQSLMSMFVASILPYQTSILVGVECNLWSLWFWNSTFLLPEFWW